MLPACWMPVDDPARHGADIGLAVAANFGLIVDTAQGDARQLPVQAPGDAEGDGCLADAGGAHQAKDLPLGASGDSCRTAKDSKIRSLTFSRP